MNSHTKSLLIIIVKLTTLILVLHRRGQQLRNNPQNNAEKEGVLVLQLGQELHFAKLQMVYLLIIRATHFVRGHAY